MESGISAYGPTAAMVVVGLVVLVLALKIAKFVFKLAFGFIALALIAAAIWWFLQGH